MRILLLLLFVIPGLALADNAGRVVFTYECATASLEKDGFRCLGLDGGELKIEQANWSKADKKQHAYFKYRLNHLLMRFFDLGGTTFTVVLAESDDGSYLFCRHAKWVSPRPLERKKNKYGYSCTRKNR